MMKKFTNISGSIVGQEPIPVKITEEQSDINELKDSIFKLMDDFLTIRSFGSARPELMMPTKIVGKEMFVEALTDLLSQKSNKNVVKSLESLKSSNRDWKSIEEKIDSINMESINVKEEKKISEILEKYGSDEENLKFFLESYVKKLTSKQAYEKYLIAENMIQKSNNSLLKIVSDKYLERSKELL